MLVRGLPNIMTPSLPTLALSLALSLIPAWGMPAAAPPPIFAPSDRAFPVVAANGMVSSQEPHATHEAVKILETGGNAIDAAVVLGLVKVVTLPRAGNLTGGGFMMIRDGETGTIRALDYREQAPAAAHRDMFLDAEGNPDPVLSRQSHLASGVPGTVAGLALALETYGTLTWEAALAPAIRIAEEGFPVGQQLHKALLTYKSWLANSPAAMRAFYDEDGNPPRPGELLKRPHLAQTLRTLAKAGPLSFYTGSIAQTIADDMEANGGLITMEDLAAYRPKWREPIHGTYRGYDIYAMPAPSSGGIHLIQMLNILELYPFPEYEPYQATPFHWMIEAMRQAYADRSKFLGDPDFTDIPVNWLTSKAYAFETSQSLSPSQARDSKSTRPGTPTIPRESPETTHYSIMDSMGNVVANTTTLNFSFGSGYMIPGTGLLLNNEMDDFSAKPGVPNAVGLIGGTANAVEPHKRMLSSMTPTLVFKAGSPYLATGSPGGSRIITTVLQIIINVLDHDMNLAMATLAPRIHHQWLPDEVRLEEGVSPDTRRLLESLGHTISANNSPMGSANSVLYKDGLFRGFADPRREGSAQGY